MVSYVGVTGFMKREEVRMALDVFPSDAGPRLMVGVLATWKTLRGLPVKPKWQKQMPNPLTIDEVFVGDPRALNLVHYSAGEDHALELFRDLHKLRFLGGPHFNGFQLNLAWPEIRQLQDYREAFGYEDFLVLQIGAKAVEERGGSPQKVAELLYHYGGIVDAMLFDPSSGHGRSFDTECAREFLRAIRNECGTEMGLGVAGGLGPNSLSLVQPLLEEFPDLNIDAQGLLRDEDNDLDMCLTRQYLKSAILLLTSSC